MMRTPRMTAKGITIVFDVFPANASEFSAGWVDVELAVVAVDVDVVVLSTCR